MRKKTTLYDVAKESGVSPKTVSRVINSEASVSTKKREAVHKAIKLLGYKPNTSARSLRSKRAYVLGLLYDNVSPAYILDLQAGILSVCEKAGFNMLIHPCNFNSDNLIDNIRPLLEQSRVDGLILSPPLSDHPELIAFLKKQSTKYVRIAPIDHDISSPFVVANDRESARQMTDHLINLGHSAIAFINGDAAHGAAIERFNGYQDALINANLKAPKELYQQGDFSFESGEICAHKLLTQTKRPSAIFACNDYMAAGAMKAATKLHIKVPEQLSIAGFDDAPVSRQIWPALTTIRQPVKEMSAVCTQLLIDLVLKDTKAGEPVNLKCELVIRESTAELF